MSVTFAEARQLVTEALADSWPVCGGTFYVALTGHEDATHWLLIVGAREAIVDGRDEEFTPVGMPFVAVEKATGEIEEWPQIEHLHRVQSMTPCGVADQDPRLPPGVQWPELTR